MRRDRLTDRQTDRRDMTELMVDFHNFANAFTNMNPFHLDIDSFFVAGMNTAARAPLRSLCKIGVVCSTARSPAIKKICNTCSSYELLKYCGVFRGTALCLSHVVSYNSSFN